MRYLVFVPYLLVFSGIGLSYFGLIPAMVGWVLSALGVLFGLALVVTMVFAKQKGMLQRALLAALPAIVAIPMIISHLRYPRINDVTTDVENPPAFVAALQAAPNSGRDMSFPEKNGAIIREEYPNVLPLVLDEPIDQAFQRVEALVKAQPGWVTTRVDATARILEGEVETSFFRFVDDFVIQVSDQEGRALINMRSKSRDGLADAGANAKRIQALFEQLEGS